MPVLDIAVVSKTLQKLIKKRVADLIIDAGLLGDEFAEETLSVLLQPPDQLNGKGKYVIGLYLYHLSEDAHFQNLPHPQDEGVELRYTPMGLNLHYQLTVHSDAENDPNASIEREQLLMGLAVKTMRDFPVITESTKIDSEYVLGDKLRDDCDRLRVVLQPIAPNEAVSFWTAGSSPLRLAAYYQVSVVLLEPEETKSRTGRVLSYGAYSFVSGTPRLDSSENVISFNPDPTGASAPRQVTIRPAQVPLGGVVTFKGSSLTGDKTSLILRSSRWEEEALVDDGSWNLAVFTDRVEATIRPTVAFTDRDDTIVPGVYSARIRAKAYRTVSDGSIREFDHASNETPFVVTARVDDPDVLTPSPAGALELRGYGFQHPALPEDSLEVRVGNEPLTSGTSGALGPGEFAVESTSTIAPPLPDDPQTLSLVMPAGLEAGSLVPLRVFVNGAESPPKWIQVP